MKIRGDYLSLSNKKIKVCKICLNIYSYIINFTDSMDNTGNSA